LDNKGLIHYVGRKDYQVKLRGQRIELAEIEKCLVDASSHVSACVVIKWADEHLIAYTQGFNINEKQLLDYCRHHLPPFMVPSMIIILDQFPLNSNGKLDRKQLPQPDFSALSESDDVDSSSLTALEEHLLLIVSQVLHIASPKVNVTIKQMGGTSLDLMRLLVLIRQEVCAKIDISFFFSNPSVRQLAENLETLIMKQEEVPTTVGTTSLEDSLHRPMPNLLIELMSILLLACQWFYPIWKAFQCDNCFALLLVPVIHLLFYVICRRLLFSPGEMLKKIDTIYSWRYYRWSFLNNLWIINNSYWLQHVLGTPFYNWYLRACGARIGCHTQIYTTFIDAPWLLEVGESTFIADEIGLLNLNYNDQTYELHPICIGSHCTIDTRSILYNPVNMQDHVHIKPMSVVTGHISPVINYPFVKNRSLSCGQMIYQLLCLVLCLSIHSILLILTYLVHKHCSTWHLPLPVNLALCWLFWSVIGLFVSLVLLKFVVGHIKPGQYPVNSYYYLHKLWLRQLIISSFLTSLKLLTLYDELSIVFLRWLGAYIEDDVKVTNFHELLCFPSNLLKLERSVTIFARAKLASFEMTHAGDCRVDQISLGSGTTLGNGCTLMPGTELETNTMVGNLTRVTRETRFTTEGVVLLGIPARPMPFMMPDKIEPVKKLPSFCSAPYYTFTRTCLIFLIGKFLIITLYSVLPAMVAPLVHIVLFCIIYHSNYLYQRKKASFTYLEIAAHTYQLPSAFINDFFILIAPFLSRTQFLVMLFRALGAQIGHDVILSDISCLTDPQFVIIGDHVRLNMGAYIQVTCHSIVFSFALSFL
jgi:acetyltransferase-like isoleucine patch superfamily enzyme